MKHLEKYLIQKQAGAAGLMQNAGSFGMNAAKNMFSGGANAGMNAAKNIFSGGSSGGGGQQPAFDMSKYTQQATPEQAQQYRRQPSQQATPSPDYSNWTQRATDEQAEQYRRQPSQQATPDGGAQTMPYYPGKSDGGGAQTMPYYPGESPRGGAQTMPWKMPGGMDGGYKNLPGAWSGGGDVIGKGMSAAQRFMQQAGDNQGRSHSGGYGGSNMMDSLRNFIPR